jgi:hypothetical protein
MKKIIFTMAAVLIYSTALYADSGTFGNPYPARSTAPSYGGQVFILPPPTSEQPVVRNVIDYSYYNNRPSYNSGDFISRSTRNVMSWASGPGRTIPIRGGVSRRGIVNGTSIFVRRFSSMRRYR